MTDEAERQEAELDIPAELARREARLATIQAVNARLEERQREADRAQESFTDPQSRIIKHASRGFEQSYNAHTQVDAHRQLIVAAELSNRAAESDRLPVLLDAVAATAGNLPAQALADAGFRSEEVLARLSGSPREVIIALGRQGREATAMDAEWYPHGRNGPAVEGRGGEAEAYRLRRSSSRRTAGSSRCSISVSSVCGGIDKVRVEWRLVCMVPKCSAARTPSRAVTRARHLALAATFTVLSVTQRHLRGAPSILYV